MSSSITFFGTWFTLCWQTIAVHWPLWDDRLTTSTKERRQNEIRRRIPRSRKSAVSVEGNQHARAANSEGADRTDIHHGSLRRPHARYLPIRCRDNAAGRDRVDPWPRLPGLCSADGTR